MTELYSQTVGGDSSSRPDRTPADSTDPQGPATGDDHSGPSGDMQMGYGRFAAMIGTSTIVMFFLMYLNTYAWDHARWSETRVYMALLMGATMALVMLGFMLSMYRNTKLNLAIVGAAVLAIAGSLWLVRGQETVQDRSWMRAMIPHHSIAILTSERAEIEDLRVCALAVEIIEAQQREIDEMDWLIDDIATNGPAVTIEEANARPVPEFPGSAQRVCADGPGN